MHSPWKKDFPALRVTPDKARISYLDSAATCQVPQVVIDAVSSYLSNGQGNAGRGMHGLSENASARIDDCRNTVAEFIGCHTDQVIFTKGATESINLVAASLRAQLKPSDSILVTALEHHSNLLPWQRLSEQTGVRLNILPIDSEGNLNLENLEQLLQDDCQLLSMTHGSNVLGNHPNVEQLIKQAKGYGVKTLIDGAQAVSHLALNLAELGCDYYAFSGHKLYSAGGSGVLFCKDHTSLEPLLLGGGIVAKTTFDEYKLIESPSRLEAGSANLATLVGLATAIEYVNSIGLDKIQAHEQLIINYLKSEIKNKTQFKIISHPSSNSLVSFLHPTIHCHDVAAFLASKNVAVRAGHHCAQPCLSTIGVKHCARASVGLYNDFDDVDQLIEGLLLVERAGIG
jgi:cysteine desulfurase / selenocysteine lyase